MIKAKRIKINEKVILVPKDRKSDALNKRQYVKQSDKIYNRKKEKEKIRKELMEG